ncbi:MAG TPA: hypothetical protein PK296_01705 [Paludibacteraceae bacterium]|nr:hypothetical protein [Paludibacteraceae bacterium]
MELLFKQLKQQFSTKYFLGDNENAIKITDILCVNCKFVAYSRSGASKNVVGIS